MSSGFFQPFLDDYLQMLDCPDPLLLEAYRTEQLSGSQVQDVQTHIVACAACRLRLEHLTQTPALSAEGTPPAPTTGADAESSLPAVAPGQIWSTRAQLKLSDWGLPDSDANPVEAGFLRLFVLTAIGPCHFGRYQEVSLCPLTELTDLASAQDLILAEGQSPFGEPLMLESWNQAPALTLQLERCHGMLSNGVMQDLQHMLQDQPSSARRGGRVISSEGPHARFQVRERAQLAYLAAPLQALAELRRLSAAYLLRISPKGFQLSGAQPAPSSLFAVRRTQARDRLLAASTDLTSPAAAEPLLRDSLMLTEDLLLELWVEGENLEFYACSSEQRPLTGLSISWPDRQGQVQCLLTDALGTAFVPLAELARGEILLMFELQQPSVRKLLPIALS
ncbi:MAG: hypothetical protein CVV27_04870 [Candidatus Melainabacteria bacterium HGW-Melainabacteria-1]|nr:MAG: hypothetical protein CVV27_04870 [Candidatus Melainabacteria bacterium HGW-Melainabacteria-1]